MSEQTKAYNVKWRLENIRPWFRSKDDSLSSPPFIVKPIMDTRWKLILSQKWRRAENCISLSLQRDIDDYPEHIGLNYELSFLGHDGSPLKSRSYKSKFAEKSISQELNVRRDEILDDKNEAYLPEGVLTVSVKLWKVLSTISSGGQCSILSVIGRKCVILDGVIEYLSTLANSNLTLNFMSPSDGIFVHFDVHPVLDRENVAMFERAGLECKSFSWYSCKLFFWNSTGQKVRFTSDKYLATLLSTHKTCSFSTYYTTLTGSQKLKNDALPFQLEITYFPGVESEYIEYDYINCKKLTPDLENESTANLDDINSCHHLTETEHKACDIQNSDSDDEECFDATGKKHSTSTTFKEDMASLYNDRLFCDTKLRTDTEIFPAHRNVLSARSPVFKKMFTTDMKEKAGECINVPGISTDTVRRMLQFLYTDCTGDLEMQSAKDLYIASDKYDIASLKQRCSSYMKKNLGPANVCDVLVLADMLLDKDLESAAQEYVLTNEGEVFYSDEWKLFIKNYACLSAKVMYLKITKK